jgi:hypothetical protein
LLSGVTNPRRWLCGGDITHPFRLAISRRGLVAALCFEHLRERCGQETDR